MRTILLLARVGVVLLLGAVAGCATDPTGLTRHDLTVTAQFDNGAGLYVGNAVSVLGMPVGKVTAIDPRGTHVDVTMRLDGGVKIPAAATAVTVSTSVLTDRHVEFTPVYRGGETLRDHAHLGLDHTRTPVDFDRFLAAADTMGSRLQGDKPGSGPIADLLNVAAAATDGHGADVRATLNSLSQALKLGDDSGARTRDSVTQIVDQLSSLSRAASDNDAAIRDFGSETRQLTDLLADLNIGTGNTGAQIDDILRQTDDLLTKNRDGIRATVAQAGTVTKSLADYRDQIAEFLDDTPLLLDNAYNAVDFAYRGVRVHSQLEKIFFDGQLVKEVCNVLGLRQLGCATGTLQDFGPDFGITDMLTAMSRLPK